MMQAMRELAGTDYKVSTSREEANSDCFHTYEVVKASRYFADPDFLYLSSFFRLSLREWEWDGWGRFSPACAGRIRTHAT